ncbi:tRNA(Ile)(2)-agmatinylcytidine synthase [Acidianus manzaensis]|uniref:tRNA(Ile2) 2-agmatinylcytidine synthetase TiaS n=1 Tax=Acidianus manzaensis TaxID=282676 RepID=A0A1W6K031_9CREN|nr:tRNA(Ile)(2)-agmatinylcytidine synthase [Acidianus manzaensis]ARM75869.1 tRNA(Ile2) 2-agmatinylcytidine synthetase TiaS [Acidianus manzaensis]
MKYIIGIDDHDSPKLGCTTHFSTSLIKILYKNNIKLLDFPYLIRLNPNIPWKTRGNAAIKLIIESERDKNEIADIIWNESIKYVEEISKGFEYNRKPGVAIVESNKSKDLFPFYIKAVSDVIPLDLAMNIANSLKVEIRGSRGIIGSLAAIGFYGITTFELLTYRFKENWFKQRKIDLDSLIEFDSKYFPFVFANVDYIRKKPLILSHGTDPVLYGIRGLEPKILLNGLYDIKVIDEDIEKFMIFKSNQATDAHLLKTGEKPYQTISKQVIVKEIKVLTGGDVLIKPENENDIIIVYKETGELNLLSKYLENGDKITVIGAEKPSSKFGKIIEVERLQVEELKEKIVFSNPRCPICGGPSESVGTNKGLRCKKCGHRFIAPKVKTKMPRQVSIGIYQSRYYRHLTKPIFLDLNLNRLYDTEILGELIKKL